MKLKENLSEHNLKVNSEVDLQSSQGGCTTIIETRTHNTKKDYLEIFL